MWTRKKQLKKFSDKLIALYNAEIENLKEEATDEESQEILANDQDEEEVQPIKSLDEAEWSLQIKQLTELVSELTTGSNAEKSTKFNKVAELDTPNASKPVLTEPP